MSRWTRPTLYIVAGSIRRWSLRTVVSVPSGRGGGRVHDGELARRERGQPAVGPPGFLPGQLDGAQDGGLIGLADQRFAVGQLDPARRLADAARIEIRHLAVRQHERAAVFEEERPLLRKKRLEDREIQHGGIGFHLPEIGVQRRGDGGGRAQAHAHVQAAVERGFVPVVRDGGVMLPAREREGHQLDAAGRRQSIGEHEVAEARHDALHASEAWASSGSPRPSSRPAAPR